MHKFMFLVKLNVFKRLKVSLRIRKLETSSGCQVNGLSQIFWSLRRLLNDDCYRGQLTDDGFEYDYEYDYAFVSPLSWTIPANEIALSIGIRFLTCTRSSFWAIFSEDSSLAIECLNHLNRFKSNSNRNSRDWFVINLKGCRVRISRNWASPNVHLRLI